jgi:hypothetical protein
MKPDEAAENLKPIFTFSPFNSLERLLQQFDHIKATGTKIVIFNLRKDGMFFSFKINGRMHFDVFVLNRQYARV